MIYDKFQYAAFGAPVAYSELLAPFSDGRLLYFGIAGTSIAFVFGAALIFWGISTHPGRVFYETKRAPAFSLSTIIPAIFSMFIFAFIALTIDVESMHNMEEPYIQDYSLLTFRNVLFFKCLGTNHFPLYPFLLKILYPLSGNLYYIRLLSGIFFSTAIYVFFQFSRQVFNLQTAILLVLFFSFSPFLLYYSKNAQPYALLLFETVFFVYLLVRYIRGYSPSRISLIVVAIAGGYTHQFFWILIFSSIMAVLINPGRHHHRIRCLVPVLGLLIVFCSPLFLFEVVMYAHSLPGLTLLHKSKNIFVDDPMHFFMRHFRDFLRLLGMQVSMISPKSIPIFGTMVLSVIFASLIPVNQIKKNENYLIYHMTVFIIVLYIALGGYYQKTGDDAWGGWYPLWRHGIVIIPFIFFSFGHLIQYGIRKRQNWIYVIVFCFLLIQIISAQRIVFRKNIPDVKNAWRYISKNMKNGDGFVATPVPAYLLNVFPYYMDITVSPRDFAQTRWIHASAQKDILWRINTLHVPFEDIKRVGFLERIWEIRFDYKFYGLYPEFGSYGAESFDAFFTDWKMVKEKKFSYIIVRLFESPQWPILSDDLLQVHAGTNDLPFIRGVRPSVFYGGEKRLITSDGQFIAPFGELKRPCSIEIINDKHSEQASLALDDKGAVRIVLSRKGYIIPLDWAAGTVYKKIIVRYCQLE